MSEPVVFISHFTVKEGKLADLRHLAAEVQRQLHDVKPRTVAYLMYLNDEGTEMTIVHTFPDAESMDLHFVGSDERSAAAFELLEPRGWEIYGRPNEGALETMRQAAESSGVSLVVRPDLLDGFLRLRSI